MAQNFYAPVTYTVTAADSSKISYTVIVKAGVDDRIFADIVYMGSSNNNFYALNAHTDSLIWKDSTSGQFQYSTPSIDNGVIFVGCVNGYLYAFDALTGATKWSYLTGSSIEAGLRCTMERYTRVATTISSTRWTNKAAG